MVTFAMVPSMVAVLFVPKLCDRFGKWKVMMGSFALQIIAYLIIGMKVGTGLGSAVVGWALAFGNYDGMAAVQPDSAISSMIALYSWIPLVLAVVTAAIMYFTNVEKDIAKLRAEK